MRPAAAAAAVLLLAVLGLALPAACLPRQLLRPPSPHPSALQGGRASAAAGEAEEEKVRLGSSPPSCRGKCYECSPCTAVQVPTMSAVPSGPVSAARADEVATLSNYKPVGWKCQCRDRLYEP